MKNIVFYYLSFAFVIVCVSCQKPTTNHNPSVSYTYSLSKAEKRLHYNISGDVNYLITTLFPFVDKDGCEYISFQNGTKNEMLFYKKERSNLHLKLNFDIEGPRGVGKFIGYWIDSFDEIYLTSVFRQEITKVDTTLNILKKYIFKEASDGTVLMPHRSASIVYTPGIILDSQIYISQRPYPGLALSETFLTAKVDVKTQKAEKLPFLLPPFAPKDINMNKLLGDEFYYSRCYNDSCFIYSFYYDENIYIASLDHSNIYKIPIKSKYIKALDNFAERPEDTMEGVKITCERPCYGNLIYDPYRKLYYRFAYPSTEMEDGINYFDIYTTGRKKFSIIILDKDFNIIGETLFPEYTYVSSLFFVDQDGLYIGSNHFKSPDFNEDVLKFECFELKKTN